MPNNIEIRGNLVRDPELKYIASGKALLSFTAASNRTVTLANGNTIKKTYFANCKCWINADLWNDWLTKGTSVVAIGEIEQEEWTGKDGQKKTRDVVNVSSLSIPTPWLCAPKGTGPEIEDDEFPSDIDDEDVPL